MTGAPMLLGALLIWQAGSPPTPTGILLDKVVATVDHDAVTLSEIRDEVGRERSADTPENERKAAENLIEKKLVDKEAQRLGIVVSEEDVDDAVQDVMRKNGMTLEDLKKNIATQGLTLVQYRDRLRAQIEKARIIGKELRQRVTVSDEEMRSYYQAHTDLFSQPEEARIQHIFLKVPPGADERQKKAVRARAEEILKDVKAGKDFSRLARIHSEDANTADRRGDLGFVKRGELQSGFDRVAFSLKPGQAGLVETPYGYHVVRVIDRRPPRVVPYDDVADQVRESLIQAKAEKVFHEWVGELKQKAVIEFIN